MDTLKSSPAMQSNHRQEQAHAYSDHRLDPGHQAEPGAGAGRPSQDWAWLKQMAA